MGGTSSLSCDNRCWAKAYCEGTFPGSKPVKIKSHNFSPNVYKCKCNLSECWYYTDGSHIGCRKTHVIMKPVCLTAGSSGNKPAITNCLSDDSSQKWSIQPYRTTWQARIGYSIYKKGPQVV